MKKKTKKACKILSVFLALLIAIQILPLQVLAENIANLLSNQETTNTSVDENSAVSILYEVEEKRDEHTKVYKKSDGSYTAVKTKDALHYLNNGVWEEINNSISLDGNFYTNMENLFNVELPKNIDSNENLTVEKDGYELSFTVDDIDDNSTAIVENNIAVSDTDIPVVNEAIAQTQSSVTYNNVADDTDIQYIITPNSIKENIIVSDKESVKSTYTFTFASNGLDAEKLDNGSVVFKDELNEIKFKIPRPVMTDSKFAFSYDINVNLIENTGNTITLEYSPSSEWINRSDRVYPITIDPAITIDCEEPDFIEDTCVEYNSDVPDLIYQNKSDAPLAAVVNMQTGVNGDGTTTTLDSEVYTRIDTDYFDNLGKDIIFTEVQYLFAGVTTANGKLLAREITGDWNVNTVTYEKKPQLSNETIDYYTSPLNDGEEFENFVFIHFNITKSFNEWFNGKTNNGFAITAVDDAVAIMMINGGSQNTAMILDYVDIGGYNENLSYHSQYVGRAGTGYVNDFTQHLSVIRDDITTSDDTFPISIGMIYDSASYGKLESLNYTNMMAYGNNWTPNYLRAYIENTEDNFTYYAETGSIIDFKRLTNQKDDITFEEVHSDIYGHRGYELKYVPEDGDTKAHYIVHRPDGYVENFNSEGLLISVTNPTYPDKSINIVYDDMSRIDYITDTNNFLYDYNYCERTNLLLTITRCCTNCLHHNESPIIHTHESINCPHMPNEEAYGDIDCTPIQVTPCELHPAINYTYDEKKNLKSVIFPDNKYITYNYDNDGNIISIRNIDGYQTVYNYDANGKVIKVTEQAFNGTTYEDGNFITYDQLNTYQTKLTDVTGAYEIYHFGIYGNLLYTIDNNDRYVIHEDVDSTDETNFASASDYRSFSENFLKNSSFEEMESDDSLKNWEITKTSDSESSEALAVSTTEQAALLGSYVLKIRSDDNGHISVKQSVNVSSGGKYTLSAYVFTSEDNIQPLMLNLYHNDMLQSDVTKSITTTNGKWDRYTLTFDAPVDTETLTVELTNANGGTFYIDGIQLEHASSAGLYNYVTNSSFNDGLNNWTSSSNLETEATNINGKAVNAIKIPGNTDGETTVSQTITFNGRPKEKIRVGVWFNGNYKSSITNNIWLNNLIDESTDPYICNFKDDRSEAYVEVTFGKSYSDATQTFIIPFVENINNWQFVARDCSLNSNYDKATITIHYKNNANNALLSNVELTSTKMKTTDLKDHTTKCPCNTCSEKNCQCECAYAGTCKCEQCKPKYCICTDCTEINCSCRCDSKDICYCTQCIPKKDSTKKYAFGYISLGNNYDEIITSQLLSQRIGDNVVSNYNLSNGLYKTVVDAAKTFTSYNYDRSGILRQISANGNIVDFTYENDKITTINQNNTIYQFSYDNWGQLTNISIDDNPIVSYRYNSSEFRDRISQVIHYNSSSNPTVMTFEYGIEDNNIKVSINNEEKFICTLNTNGTLEKITETNGRVVYYFENGIEKIDVNNDSLYKFNIDTSGNYVETVGGKNYITKLSGLSYADCEYIDELEVSSNNEKSIVAKSYFDARGRYSPGVEALIQKDSKAISATSLSLEYPNISGLDDISTDEIHTADITAITRFGSVGSSGVRMQTYKYKYEYDNNNNIVLELLSPEDNNNSPYYECRYLYDENNQLIRVNQISYAAPQSSYDDYIKPPIVNPEQSKTITYEYDNAGNILFKKEYEYTLDENLTDDKLIKVIPFEYISSENQQGNKTVNETIDELCYDNVWNDQLISFNETSITYDNIGNPIYIGQKCLNWNGKLLEQVVDGDKAIDYRYDINGICYRKNVSIGDFTETYDYLWSEGKLIGQIFTNSDSVKYSIKYIYDVFNTPVGFIINNASKEHEYVYLKNMKGDIIGIVNDSGKMVLTYEYDVWGTMSQPYTDSTDEFFDIVSKTPLTYRGYFYDYDLGMYYIQGRYYNPEFGRFINTDSMSNLGQTGTALSYNLYTYCENNPVMYVVDNKDTSFSNTINANYHYNKRISKRLNGYIDNQEDGIASKLRYGNSTLAPFGCGTVATYNALIMLGNRTDPCDIIREYESNNVYRYGFIGTHGNNIARYFSKRGYNVTVTNFEDNEFDNRDFSSIQSIIQDHKVNILYYKSSNVGHFIAIQYTGEEGKEHYITYNENTGNGSSNSIKDFFYSTNKPHMLISISPKSDTP